VIVATPGLDHDRDGRREHGDAPSPGPTLLRMRWEDVLFAHWPVEPAVVRDRLPPEVALDTFDGRAWLGVVPFVMADIRPRGVPVGRSFPELNLRTYVRHGGDRGVYFFSLDAGDRLGTAVARTAFGLAYRSAETDVRRRGTSVCFRSRRRGEPSLRFDATYGPDGEPFDARERPLTRFLVERYRFFAPLRGGLFVGTIDHDPWTLRPGRLELRQEDCFRANAFAPPAGDPTVHYCPGIDVTAGLPRPA